MLLVFCFPLSREDTVVGFNFDIDLSVWTHKVITEKDRFFIGIKMPDGKYHSFHGVNRNGNVGTLLYVNGNEKGRYPADARCVAISDLTEQYVKGELSFDDACRIVKDQEIVYAKDATMQAMLSDRKGRVLIIEPGIGHRHERKRYSLMTNYSILDPEITRPYIVSGDDRFERAKEQLEKQDGDLSVTDAFKILRSVRQEGIWATRVSFVYPVQAHKVFYVLDNRFGEVKEFQFDMRASS
ncbi:MAG: conjugal transfer protein [Lachnospiraceae bacterium]|nr:conjugal transfer protein [Lachnospiraceae bacterium]